MLDQLTKNLEPLLMTYGIWVALFLAVMVLIPVGIVIWMQKRHQQQENDLLSEHFQVLAGFQQQLTGMETVLSQYQQQAAGFGEASRARTADLLQRQEECLSQLLRLKSELRDIEARLPQLGDQLPARLETAEEQLENIKQSFESVETWYKQLYQGVADTRTQLHQLQAELQTQPAATPAGNQRLQTLWEHLRALQAETSPADPVAYLQAVQELAQGIRAHAEAETAQPAAAPMADTGRTSAEAPPMPAAEIAEEPVTAAFESEAPGSEAEWPAPEVSSAPEAEPAAGPPAQDVMVDEPAAAEESAESQPRAQASDLESELDQLFPEAEADTPVKPAETLSGNFRLSELSPEQVQALRQGISLPQADTSDAAGLFDQAAFDEFLAEDAVTETFLGQRGDSEAQAGHAAETDEVFADRKSDETSEAVVEAFLGQRGFEPERPAETAAPAAIVTTPDEIPSEITGPAEERMAAPAMAESAPFRAARTRLEGLADSLAAAESLYREVEDAFVPEAWAEALPLLDRCRYLAAEAEEMLKLALRLQDTPQAPGHRVQLNLKRLQQKCQQVEGFRQQLSQTREQLHQDAGELKSRLIAATEQLQALRGQVESAWLQEQAGRLKDVRQALDHQPLHLPAARQQMRQVEIAVDLQAQS